MLSKSLDRVSESCTQTEKSELFLRFPLLFGRRNYTSDHRDPNEELRTLTYVYGKEGNLKPQTRKTDLTAPEADRTEFDDGFEPRTRSIWDRRRFIDEAKFQLK